MITYFIISFLLNSSISCSAGKNENLPNISTEIKGNQNSIFGKWRVTKFVSSAFSEIDEQKAKEFLGKIVNLTDDTTKLFNETCPTPGFNIRKVNSEEYFYYNYRFHPKELNIESKEVNVLELYCSNQGITDFSGKYPDFDLVMDNDRLIYYHLGFFFILEKEM